MELLSIIFSTSVVYLFIVLALRLTGKSEMAQLTSFDLVFVMLLSNAVQNAMVGANTSLVGGLVAAATLFAINGLVKDLLYRQPKLEHMVQGEPLLLVYEGFVKEENLKKARMTVNDLQESIRQHGLESLDQVKLAVMEVDGNISIIPADHSLKSTRS